jgi:fatty-acyl-CoA synthase
MLRNTAEFFALEFGLTRIGAITVPLNYLLAPEEIRFIVDNSSPSTIVFDTEIAGRDMIKVLTDAGIIPAQGEKAAIELVARSREPEGTAGWISLDEYLAAGRMTAAPDVGAPDLPCAIMYTAGSTGTPKGVILTSGALQRESYGTALTRGFTPDWCSLTALPPFHLFGFAQCVLPPTFIGGKVMLQERFDPVEQLKEIKSGSITDLVGVAAMFYRLLDLMNNEAYPLGSLRSAYVGGDMVPESGWQRIRDGLGIDEITSGFGSTETQGTSFMVPPGHSNEILANTIGWPSLSGCAGLAELGGAEHEWRLVDVATGQLAAPGEVGELQLRCPTISPGYWRIEGEADTSRRDGWFRSGDLARVREDGAAVFLGRNSETFRSGGENVSAREVEIVLSQLPAIAAAYVVGVPDPLWGQVGCAWIVPAAGQEPDLAALIDHCRANLAKYKVPKHVYVIAETAVPTSPSGKLRKRALVDLALDRIASEKSATAPTTVSE